MSDQSMIKAYEHHFGLPWGESDFEQAHWEASWKASREAGLAEVEVLSNPTSGDWAFDEYAAGQWWLEELTKAWGNSECEADLKRACLVACNFATEAFTEVEALRKDAERAAYWKQRAKSAEGHLFSSDVDAGAKALHAWISMNKTPWDELAKEDQWRCFHAAFRVIAAVNGKRDKRKPGNDCAVTYAMTKEQSK